MFERYTEKARRVVFFARYEASEFGSFQIEAAYLLLGLIREDRDVFLRLLDQSPDYDEIRPKIAAQTPAAEPISTSVDIPVSAEAKRWLAYAAEEASQLGHKVICTEHLVLGLFREPDSAARQLLGPAKTLEEVRAAVRAHAPKSQPTKPLPTPIMPPAPDAKRALAFAGEEAWMANRQQVGTETCS